jgi:hypothetical protein
MTQSGPQCAQSVISITDLVTLIQMSIAICREPE